MSVPERCPKHPRYQAKRKPTSGCRTCRAIYKQRLLEVSNLLEWCGYVHREPAAKEQKG